jgi:asparagine synthase (glutamine-hydrolysing)
MCAIAGLVDARARDPDAAWRAVEAMRRALAHRGPDDWGLVALAGGRVCRAAAAAAARPEAPTPHGGPAGPLVVLAHQRLAVIDLTPSGHQPMATPDGRFWITYNGELYNYRALRAELERAGVGFRGTSDTEVLLELFAREGPDAFARCRGMFAAAIWDATTATLWLVRDRFGIKPLYYARSAPHRLLFASEVKGLLASGLVSTDPDPRAPATFLARGFLPTEATFFRDIVALPPGCWARWRSDTWQIAPYWSLARVLAGRWRRVAAAEAAGQVRAALDESVRAHLVSDVPVGVFLSGGLDSTAVLGAVRRVYSGPLRTLTVVAPGTAHDEGALARQAAARYETEHVEVVLSGTELPGCLDEFFAALDQPTADGLNTYLVARAAREVGLKVVLSGLGGDELLGGYDSFVRVPRAVAWLAVARRVPGLVPTLAGLAAALPLATAPKAAELLAAAASGAALETVWRASRRLLTDAELRGLGYEPVLLGPSTRGSAEGVVDPFARVAACELAEFMTPQLLRDTDVFALRWAVEVRTPFVDHRVLEAVRAAGRWPRGRAPSYKLALFRAGEGFAPPDHLARPKRGFFLPFEGWLRRALEAPAASPLNAQLAAILGRPTFRPFVERFVRGRLHWSRLWALYVLERFAVEWSSRWTFRSSSSATTASAGCASV